ncbi:MAG TPA: Na+/H+ antiporter NhaA, partial [Chitinophagaceae bacterium]|nr:Na+/H+ antiporter NhaA [Chitinophagaceae bacterium]
EHWVNDGLMVIFFLLVGLEIERELYVGELSTFRNAILPVIAAAGGMLVPAGIHFLFNAGQETQAGFGIPMATDIAFALGILSLAGKRVPVSLKVFLTALAIIDDLGAITVIAIFYTEDFSITYFLLSMGVFALLFVLGKFKMNYLVIYLLGGVLMWYFMLRSGVHATIAGVLLAFAIPFHGENKKNMSYKLQHFLHKPVAFIILPIFALANTAIILPNDIVAGLLTMNSLGIICGLVIGKLVGIWLASFIAVKSRLAALPSGVNWKQIMGLSLLGGIGFTMSIFITNLAFSDEDLITSSKLSILLASVVAAIAGLVVLRRESSKRAAA